MELGTVLKSTFYASVFFLRYQNLNFTLFTVIISNGTIRNQNTKRFRYKRWCKWSGYPVPYPKYQFWIGKTTILVYLSTFESPKLDEITHPVVFEELLCEYGNFLLSLRCSRRRWYTQLHGKWSLIYQSLRLLLFYRKMRRGGGGSEACRFPERNK